MLRTFIFTVAIITNLFSQNSVVQQFSDAFADVAETAKPAVVTIITDKIMKVPNNDLYFFFNPYIFSLINLTTCADLLSTSESPSNNRIGIWDCSSKILFSIKFCV